MQVSSQRRAGTLRAELPVAELGPDFRRISRRSLAKLRLPARLRLRLDRALRLQCPRIDPGRPGRRSPNWGALRSDAAGASRRVLKFKYSVRRYLNYRFTAIYVHVRPGGEASCRPNYNSCSGIDARSRRSLVGAVRMLEATRSGVVSCLRAPVRSTPPGTREDRFATFDSDLRPLLNLVHKSLKL
jgi:hypothetical protein